jgi:hypothetical protein
VVEPESLGIFISLIGLRDLRELISSMGLKDYGTLSGLKDLMGLRDLDDLISSFINIKILVTDIG